MTMTNKQAIEESLKMWEAILEGWPDVWKHDYLKTWNPDRETWPKNYCFICEKVIGNGEDAECPGNCIIIWGCDEPYACEGCEDSPYAIFDERENSLEDREQAVVDIIRLHREALGRENDKDK